MARSSCEYRRVRYFNECCVREGRNHLCLLLFAGRHSAVWLEITITAAATSSDMTHGILLCFCMSPEKISREVISPVRPSIPQYPTPYLPPAILPTIPPPIPTLIRRPFPSYSSSASLSPDLKEEGETGLAGLVRVGEIPASALKEPWVVIKQSVLKRLRMRLLICSWERTKMTVPGVAVPSLGKKVLVMLKRSHYQIGAVRLKRIDFGAFLSDRG